jgi:hypothetical protein
VVDLAGNGELFDYIIKKRKLAEDEARWYFRQIISAVERIFYYFNIIFIYLLILLRFTRTLHRSQRPKAGKYLT